MRAPSKMVPRAELDTADRNRFVVEQIAVALLNGHEYDERVYDILDIHGRKTGERILFRLYWKSPRDGSLLADGGRLVVTYRCPKQADNHSFYYFEDYVKARNTMPELSQILYELNQKRMGR